MQINGSKISVMNEIRTQYKSVFNTEEGFEEWANCQLILALEQKRLHVKGKVDQLGFFGDGILVQTLPLKGTSVEKAREKLHEAWRVLDESGVSDAFHVIESISKGYALNIAEEGVDYEKLGAKLKELGYSVKYAFTPMDIARVRSKYGKIAVEWFKEKVEADF